MLPSYQRPDFNNWNDKKYDKDLSDNERTDGIKKLGPFFEKRGFTSGKVQFSVEFDQIIQNQLASQSIIQNMRRQRNQHSMS